MIMTSSDKVGAVVGTVGDIMSTVGDIIFCNLSTVGDIMIHMLGHHDTYGGIS